VARLLRPASRTDVPSSDPTFDISPPRESQRRVVFRRDVFSTIALHTALQLPAVPRGFASDWLLLSSSSV
jgi:hypothetical protein